MEKPILTEKEIIKSSPSELFTTFKTSEKGLTSEEARTRLETFGPNELETKKTSPALKFLSYFWGPIPWMIEVAAVLSLLVEHWNDFIIILVLLVFNACIGFWEEHKAENALEALKKGLALKAHALRSGQWIKINASELVPGDIIKISIGDIVPADVKLLQGDYISIDQSALTGESLPVSKKVNEIAYSGSIVKKGEMAALVTSTGLDTYFGRTAKLVAAAGAVSHFQRAVMRIGDFLILIALALSSLLIAVELYLGAPFLELLQFVLILVIASIPVAMPAVLSVTMALGALSLSKEKAIVSRLQAIEELAGVNILCSDKTGTLTKNQLTLGEPIIFEAEDASACIFAAALASQKDTEDSIDSAVIAGVQDQAMLDLYKQTHFTPFDPVSKRTESVVEDESGRVGKYTKGAPQVIMGLCGLSDENMAKATDVVNDLASKGYRALGVAASTGENGWRLMGILPLFDPPRDDSKETIERAKSYGLSVKMVTGDNAAIAREISGQLGLGMNIRPAGEFFQEGRDFKHVDPLLAEQIEKAEGFAEVYPEHKYGIVKALQERGNIVVMTGDGVNDAPALKQADIGIAVSGATDAARAAAALILTAPGLSVIINALKEARRIFERMLSYIIYRIAMTFDIMVFVVLAMLLFPFLQGVPYQPLTPIMIILLALLDDIPIMAIAYDNTRISGTPVRWKMGRILSISTVFGLMSVVQTFGLFLIGIAWMRSPERQNWIPLNLGHLQTVIFLQLVAGGHLMLFLTRTKDNFYRPPYPSKELFAAIVGTQIFAVLVCAFGWFVPAIPWTIIGLVWAYNLVWMFAQDIVKKLSYSLMENRAYHYREFLRKTKTALHPLQALPHVKK
ncbi:MAG: plasma-membrane proton-efflux P-type ATPase [Waddliaceae bacterium]